MVDKGVRDSVRSVGQKLQSRYGRGERVRDEG